MSTRQPTRPVVRVHIERLVLDGVPGFERSGDRGRLGDAVTAALSEQLRRQPIGTPSSRHRARGGPVRIGAGMSPESLGAQVARAVHRGLAR